MVYKGIINKNCINKDLDTQKNDIFEYVKKNDLFLLDFIPLHEAPNNLAKDAYLTSILNEQETCIVSHPLVFGGSIVEMLNTIKILFDFKIKVVFIECRDMSTNSNSIDASFLCAMYGDIIGLQKDIVSYRTKLGLKAAKQKGVKLGRPKGSKNKTRFLDDFKYEILDSLNKGLSSHKILTIINKKTSKNLTYPSIKYFIDCDKELSRARDNFKSNSLLS